MSTRTVRRELNCEVSVMASATESFAARAASDESFRETHSLYCAMTIRTCARVFHLSDDGVGFIITTPARASDLARLALPCVIVSMIRPDERVRDFMKDGVLDPLDFIDLNKSARERDRACPEIATTEAAK